VSKDQRSAEDKFLKAFFKAVSNIGHGVAKKRSNQMKRFMNEVWAVVEELPANAQEIWYQAFQEALVEFEGDMRKASAMAWKVFKGKRQGKRQKTHEGWDREESAKGMLLVAACGGIPEWIRLGKNYGLVLNEGRYPCPVDRRALDVIMAAWAQRDNALRVYLEDGNLNDTPAPVVGWIKEMKCRSDGLWIGVDWMEAGLGYITRKEFGYLSLIFILDKSNRPVELTQARLMNSPAFERWGNESEIGTVNGSKSQINRKLRLIKGAERLETAREGLNREELQQKTEFQEFQDFLEQGAHDAKKERMKRGFPFFRSMLKWAFRKRYEKDQYCSCG
jgi:hypothetical protein